MRFAGLFVAASMIALPAAAQEADGAALFKQHCSMCHGDPNVEGSVSRLGPELHKLQGRTAGTTEFLRYSPAMRSSGLVWDSATLDTYLVNPRATVRGTTMAFPGLRDEAARKLLVEYILGAAE